MFIDFEDRTLVIAHETGHAIVAWASPFISSPTGIRFYPVVPEAECLIEPLPEIGSSAEALECAAFAFGGAAGETVGRGAFERLTSRDLDFACWAGQVARLMGIRVRRPRGSPLVAALPRGLWSELHGFLDHAYRFALARITTHRAAYDRLQALLTRGYASGQIAWEAEELAACLGPKPT